MSTEELDTSSHKNVRDRELTAPSILSHTRALLIHPNDLLHEIQETQFLFFTSRPWPRLLIYFLCLLTIILPPLTLILGGITVPRISLVNYYQRITQLEEEKSVPITASLHNSPQRIQTTDFGRALHHRVCQISDSSFDSVLITSLSYLDNDNPLQAKLLLKRIAPSDRHGYPPAHAWLAYCLMSEVAGNRLTAETIHHLRHAIAWQGTSPMMRKAYAVYLESRDEYEEALKVLRVATDQSPKFAPSLIAMAIRHNKLSSYEKTISQVHEHLRELSNENPDDLAPLTTRIELFLLTEQPDEAMEVLKQARNQIDNTPHWNRLESEIWRFKYRQSASNRSDSASTLDISLLSTAIEADPSNPKLEAELNNLSSIGVELTESMKQHLEQTIEQGKATPLTHFIMGNEAVRADNLTAAKTHFEIACKLAPNSPIMLNNLAYALSLGSLSELQRAEKLIDHAVSMSGTNSGIRKTQAEIKLKLSKYADAAATLEKAISHDPNNPSLRELLIQAYRLAGLEDLADSHEVFMHKQGLVPHAETTKSNSPNQ